ncbi:unnamed protein product [Phytophthora fragariaefolia]|uniref:Unnamed protein product n=1 Tax=Phytophthora fragariaefolia TaxID=1490495 RepID=A0A9W7CW93_9STRA|nr:unnamed protein product [Phytophthora fragariaefolia]
MPRKRAPPQSQHNGERKRRRSKQGTADNSAYTVKLASKLDFHGVWRELKAAGWTSKPPRGLDNRYRYVYRVVPATGKLARITCLERKQCWSDGQNGGCIVDGATTQTLHPSSINKRGVPGADDGHHQAARGDACCGVGVGDGISSVVVGISQNDDNTAALRDNGDGGRTMCGEKDNGNDGADSGVHCVPSAQARPDGVSETPSRSNARHADHNITSPTAVTDSATSASPRSRTPATPANEQLLLKKMVFSK